MNTKILTVVAITMLINAAAAIIFGQTDVAIVSLLGAGFFIAILPKKER